MISNLDIERRNTGVDFDSERNKIILARIDDIQKRDSDIKKKILKSRRFIKFMERTLHRYAAGEDGIYKPIFAPKTFMDLAVSKFNSYDLECVAYYDKYSKFLLFVRRP